MKNIIILTPIYNDWSSFIQLINRIDETLVDKKISAAIVAVDDGSTQSFDPMDIKKEKSGKIKKITLLKLARNIGHQKAIALGLGYINAKLKCDAVVIMDSDGEDKPEDILKLIESGRANPHKVIFAERARRSENIIFQIFYFLYKIGFRVLTGKTIRFGNFSLVPADQLLRVTHLPEIWNHYAAGILHANIPYTSIPIERGKRYAGLSKMNFTALILHGLSAISVYIEILTARLIILFGAILIASGAGFATVLYYKFFTTLAIPGWATNTSIGLVLIALTSILLLTLLAFVILNYRSSKLFIPAKDYEDYLMDIEKIK